MRHGAGASQAACARQVVVGSDGTTFYVTNFASRQLETIQVADLVSAAKPGTAKR
jgi:DNA-binding beta-propeller fold protein YncE